MPPGCCGLAVPSPRVAVPCCQCVDAQLPLHTGRGCRLGRSGGARGELDIAAIAAELLADDGTSKGDGGKRKRPETGDTSSEEDDSDGSSSSSEEEDEKTKKAREKGKGGLRYGGSKYGGPAAKRKPPADGGGGGAAAAAAAPPKPRKPKRKIKAVLWYINPRYFVDVVRYRVYLLRVRRRRTGIQPRRCATHAAILILLPAYLYCYVYVCV